MASTAKVKKTVLLAMCSMLLAVSGYGAYKAYIKIKQLTAELKSLHKQLNTQTINIDNKDKPFNQMKHKEQINWIANHLFISTPSKPNIKHNNTTSQCKTTDTELCDTAYRIIDILHIFNSLNKKNVSQRYSGYNIMDLFQSFIREYYSLNALYKLQHLNNDHYHIINKHNNKYREHIHQLLLKKNGICNSNICHSKNSINGSYYRLKSDKHIQFIKQLDIIHFYLEHKPIEIVETSFASKQMTQTPMSDESAENVKNDENKIESDDEFDDVSNTVKCVKQEPPKSNITIQDNTVSFIYPKKRTKDFGTISLNDKKNVQNIDAKYGIPRHNSISKLKLTGKVKRIANTYSTNK